MHAISKQSHKSLNFRFIESVFLKSHYGNVQGQNFSNASTIDPEMAYSYDNRLAATAKKSRGSAAISETRDPESYYLYEIGQSDPNKLLPREFKQHYQQLPGDVSKTTYERLAEITSQKSTVSFYI